MPRWIAWRIHHVAYVENLKPLRQSNLSTAWMRPRLPSCTMSRSGRPDDWYFLAIETTSRRFEFTNWRCASSPWRTPAAQLAALGGGELLGGLELGARGDAGLDGLSEPNFVVLGQQVVATDVLEVEADEVLVVAILTTGLHGLGGHCAAFRFRRRAGCSGKGVLVGYRPFEGRSRDAGQNVRRAPRVPRKGPGAAGWRCSSGGGLDCGSGGRTVKPGNEPVLDCTGSRRSSQAGKPPLTWANAVIRKSYATFTGACQTCIAPYAAPGSPTLRGGRRIGPEDLAKRKIRRGKRVAFAAGAHGDVVRGPRSDAGQRAQRTHRFLEAGAAVERDIAPCVRPGEGLQRVAPGVGEADAGEVGACDSIARSGTGA